MPRVASRSRTTWCVGHCGDLFAANQQTESQTDRASDTNRAPGVLTDIVVGDFSALFGFLYECFLGIGQGFLALNQALLDFLPRHADLITSLTGGWLEKFFRLCPQISQVGDQFIRPPRFSFHGDTPPLCKMLTPKMIITHLPLLKVKLS